MSYIKWKKELISDWPLHCSFLIQLGRKEDAYINGKAEQVNRN